MFVTLHTNVIVVTIRISIADLIGGAATQTFAPGGKHPRAPLDRKIVVRYFVNLAPARLSNILKSDIPKYLTTLNQRLALRFLATS